MSISDISVKFSVKTPTAEYDIVAPKQILEAPFPCFCTPKKHKNVLKTILDNS